MATNFPTDIDNLINPGSTDALSAPSHSDQHSNANDAIEAIQTKIGVDGSTDPNSLDYKISDIETQLQGLEGNNAVNILGLDGNNDLEVFGIENPTVIDSFSANTWRTVKYALQVTKGSSVYTSQLTVLQDGSQIYVTESDVISTTDTNYFNYEFELNSGIISLLVTPISGEIAVRFYRTAIKK
jgi:hypothetical protein